MNFCCPRRQHPCRDARVAILLLNQSRNPEQLRRAHHRSAHVPSCPDHELRPPPPEQADRLHHRYDHFQREEECCRRKPPPETTDPDRDKLISARRNDRCFDPSFRPDEQYRRVRVPFLYLVGHGDRRKQMAPRPSPRKHEPQRTCHPLPCRLCLAHDTLPAAAARTGSIGRMLSGVPARRG